MNSSAPPPTWLVCEDGEEYTQRFTRFFPQLRFVRVTSAAALFAAARDHAASGLGGVILDLDFRRLPAAALIDEHGHAHPDLPDGERRRLAGQQGLFILRALRAPPAPPGLAALPVILCADLDDRARAAQLERDFPPLRIAASNLGLDAFAPWMCPPAPRS